MASGTILVIEATRNRSADKHVNERIAAGKCVACPPDDIRPHRRRGLCPRCEGRWTRQRNLLSTKTKKAEFDAELIRKGMLLAENEIQQLTNSNVFSDVAKEVANRD